MTPDEHSDAKTGGLITTTRSPAGRRWLAAFALGIPATYAALFMALWTRIGPRDYDQFLVFHELQYWNASLFGLAKQWSPVMCAGLSMAGEPQVPFMSLSMLLSYELGPFRGLQLATALYFVGGWIGAYLYSGLWLKPFAQRALAAALFIGNGFFFCRLAFGHIDFIPFLLLPLMLWALHASGRWGSAACISATVNRFAVAVLLTGAAISMAIDGSPVAIIHWLFWIVLYAVVLAITVRSIAPLILVICAVGLAAVLDAGYLWPMLEWQAEFPRRTADSFTSVLSLAWFALLPLRGKLLPANGNGHELSVFIGPIIGYLLWRYRHALGASLPNSMKRPLLVVSIVSIVLGMGSLALVHVPAWLSPFDLVRPLPGFRSIGVTGRYWGFLALPLSLLGAAALCRFVAEHEHPRRLRIGLGCALVLQLGFQAETVLAQWIPGRNYRPAALANDFGGRGTTIDYVMAGDRDQGEIIGPTRAVADCYDDDDFIRAPVTAGKELVKALRLEHAPAAVGSFVQARFLSWNRIGLESQTLASVREVSTRDDSSDRVRVILNQAYHPLWRAFGCQTSQGAQGNEVVECPLARWRSGPIELTFFDALSERAAEVSAIAWRLWLAAFAVLLMLAARPVGMRSTNMRVAIER